MKKCIVLIVTVACAMISHGLTLDVGPVVVQTGTVVQAEAAVKQRGTILMDGNNHLRVYDGSTVGGSTIMDATYANATFLARDGSTPLTGALDVGLNDMTNLYAVYFSDYAIISFPSYLSFAGDSGGDIDFNFATLNNIGDPIGADHVGDRGFNDNRYSFKAIAVKTTATAYTAGTTDPREIWGGMVLVTGNATITLPASEVGMSLTVKTRGAVTASINPDGTETIYLDGASVGAGDEIDSTGVTGEVVTLVCLTAGEWDATSDGWIDGGP